MDNYTLSPQEYAEWLGYKREKIIKQAELEVQEIDAKIAEILGRKPTPITENLFGEKFERNGNGDGRKGGMGWRQILEDVFVVAGRPLTYAEIVGAVMNNPDLNVNYEVAQKSISSNLGTYSKGDNIRYKYFEKDGKRFYQLA